MTDPSRPDLSHLRRPAFLTRAGLVAERGWRAFWPVAALAMVAAAPFPLRLADLFPPVVTVLWLAGFGLAIAAALAWGALRFRFPSAEEALARIDAALPGRPIAAIRDTQAIGEGDAASRALWSAHVARMAKRSESAAAIPPDLRVARHDPFGLRLIAAILFAVAVLFAVPPPAPEVGVAATPGQVLAAGPSWEGWIEPPAYAGKPSVYLADLPPGAVEIMAGSRVTIRLYGESANAIRETVSAPAGEEPLPEGQFIVAQAGEIAITGAGGAEWQVAIAPDLPPAVALAGEMEVEALGEMAQPFRASDDYGVVAGSATFALDLARVDRRYGLTPDPMPREVLVVDLPMPFTGDRAEFEERLIDDFSQHPLANLPVTMTLTVRDAAGQEAATEPLSITLPGRRFFQPVAKAVIEQRRDLLWNHANAPRVLDLLRAIAHRPEDLFTSETIYLRLNFIIRQLDGIAGRGAMTPEEEGELAQALWDLAVQIEDGTLADARERLARAQERLSEAMRNGASPEEIAELMQELREATDDYLEMLAQNAEPAEDQTDQPQSAQDQAREVTQDEIQALMDQIQQLMEEGRMAEAEALMAQLDQLLQNLQMQQAQGQGNGPRMPGQQQMEELQDTLRDQQDLSDEAFRDLQDRFNGRQPQEGEPGQEPGQQAGQEPGEEQGQQEGQQPGSGEDGPGEGSLAERQEGLRRELERQRAELPGLTGEAAERAGQALEQAEGAMDRAEEALRENDLAEAIDNQAEALNALREGLRNLAQALAENGRDPDTQQAQAQGAEGSETGTRTQPARRDPLGRQLGQSGQYGTDQQMLGGEDVYRRAEELLQELRRRAGERGREEAERDYLNRLLERF